MRKIGILAVLAAVTLLLVLGVAAVAQAATATSVDIYNDYAADGALTGPYTAAELQAYFDNASNNTYTSPAVTVPLNALVGRVLGIMKANPGMSFAAALKLALGQSTGEDRGNFPFTGFEVVLVLLGSVVLVGSGLVLRRATR
jgi:hypothetical protein